MEKMTEQEFKALVDKDAHELCVYFPDIVNSVLDSQQWSDFVHQEYLNACKICPSPRPWSVAISDTAYMLFINIINQQFPTHISYQDYANNIQVLGYHLCEDKDRAQKYWQTNEWQQIIDRSYQKYLSKCPDMKTWGMAISDMASEFHLML